MNTTALNKQTIERRLARIENKLTQLMLHFGLDAHNKVYYSDNPHADKYATLPQHTKEGNR